MILKMVFYRETFLKSTMPPSQQFLVLLIVVIFILCTKEKDPAQQQHKKILKLTNFLLNILKQFLEKPTIKSQ